MEARSITLVGLSDGRRFLPDEPGRWIGFLARYKSRRLSVTAEAERIRRSPKQNARYWSLIVPMYQEWVGEEDKLQAHEDLLTQCNTSTRILPTGEIISTVRRSRFLSVEEFNDYTTRVEMWLAKHGCEFPDEPGAPL